MLRYAEAQLPSPFRSMCSCFRSKFFDGRDAAKAKKQQSTLAFNAKSKAKDGKENKLVTSVEPKPCVEDPDTTEQNGEREGMLPETPH